MPVITGPITTYGVPENARDLSTAFSLIQFPNTPIFNRITIPGSATAKKREWWDDDRMPIGTTVGAAYTAGAGTITLASAVGLRPGSVFQIGASVYRVVSIAGNVVTKTNVVGDANQASGNKVNFLPPAKAEGGGFQDSDYTQKVPRYNNTQIFDDFIEVTGTELAVNREVQPGNLAMQQVEAKIRRMYFLMARAVANNPRVDAADNTSPRMMGGIDWFLSQYGYNPAAAAFSADNLDAFLLELEQTYGHTPAEAFMNPLDLKRFSALRASQIVLNREDKGRGEYVDRYLSGYGYDIKLTADPTLSAGKIRFFDLSQVKLLPLAGRQLQYYPMAKDGDRVRYGIVGEYTMEFNASNTTGAFSITP